MTVNFTGGARNNHRKHRRRSSADVTGTPSYSASAQRAASARIAPFKQFADKKGKRKGGKRDRPQFSFAFAQEGATGMQETPGSRAMRTLEEQVGSLELQGRPSPMHVDGTDYDTARRALLAQTDWAGLASYSTRAPSSNHHGKKATSSLKSLIRHRARSPPTEGLDEPLPPICESFLRGSSILAHSPPPAHGSFPRSTPPLSPSVSSIGTSRHSAIPIVPADPSLPSYKRKFEAFSAEQDHVSSPPPHKRRSSLPQGTMWSRPRSASPPLQPSPDLPALGLQFSTKQLAALLQPFQDAPLTATDEETLASPLLPVKPVNEIEPKQEQQDDEAILDFPPFSPEHAQTTQALLFEHHTQPEPTVEPKPNPGLPDLPNELVKPSLSIGLPSSAPSERSLTLPADFFLSTQPELSSSLKPDEADAFSIAIGYHPDALPASTAELSPTVHDGKPLPLPEPEPFPDDPILVTDRMGLGCLSVSKAQIVDLLQRRFSMQCAGLDAVFDELEWEEDEPFDPEQTEVEVDELSAEEDEYWIPPPPSGWKRSATRTPTAIAETPSSPKSMPSLSSFDLASSSQSGALPASSVSRLPKESFKRPRPSLTADPFLSAEASPASPYDSLDPHTLPPGFAPLRIPVKASKKPLKRSGPALFDKDDMSGVLDD